MHDARDDDRFLRAAIALARRSVETGGGPFGAIVVRDGVVVGEGMNRVVPGGDPTAHAEILALRSASVAVGSHELRGCTVYASCEPCPMCLAAILWARAERVVFACTRQDAADAGFDDARLYDAVARGAESELLPTTSLLREEGQQAFRDWAELDDKTMY